MVNNRKTRGNPRLFLSLFTFHILPQPAVPRRHPLPAPAGNLEDGDGRVDPAGHLPALGHVKIHVGEEVHLVEKHDIGGMEHLGVLERLVLPLGYGEDHHLVVLPQVEGSWTDQVPHILDEEEVQVGEVEMIDGMADHVGIQVAAGTGVYLLHRNPGRRDPPGVVVSLLVTLNDGAPYFSRKVPQGPFQDGGLAGSGGADQVQHEQFPGSEELPVPFGKVAILRQQIGLHRDTGAGLGAGLPFMVVMMVPLAMIVVVMFVGAAAARGTHTLLYLQFFDPQFLAGDDGMAETAAGRAGVEISAKGKLGPAVVTHSTGRNPFNDEARPFKQGPPTAGVETEFDGIGNDTGKVADLQHHDGYPLSLPVLETDIDDALGQGKFVQRILHRG